MPQRQITPPLNAKRLVVRTLTNRAQQYVTTAEDMNAEIVHVRNALRANDYPEWAFEVPPPSEKLPAPQTIIVLKQRTQTDPCWDYHM